MIIFQTKNEIHKADGLAPLDFEEFCSLLLECRKSADLIGDLEERKSEATSHPGAGTRAVDVQ